MRAMTRVVLASGNAGKLRELAALLAPLGLDLVAQSALGVEAADEPHDTFVENALAKARHASLRTGLPAIADDSGICVDALGGRPGVWSARWAVRGRAAGGASEFEDDAAAGEAGLGRSAGGGTDSDTANNARLVADLRALDARRGARVPRSAHYYCVLVLLRAHDDPQPIIADASWHGEVVERPRGSCGFGYDPHFLIPSLGRTAAELDVAVKNRLSHRCLAMRALVQRLHEAGLAQPEKGR